VIDDVNSSSNMSKQKSFVASFMLESERAHVVSMTKQPVTDKTGRKIKRKQGTDTQQKRANYMRTQPPSPTDRSKKTLEKKEGGLMANEHRLRIPRGSHVTPKQKQVVNHSDLFKSGESLLSNEEKTNTQRLATQTIEGHSYRAP
jgi:hypothetical protein